MAEPIRCDIHGLAHLADVMVTRMANGETFAACDEGYRETITGQVMGSVRPCDMHPDDHPADVIVAQLALGETLALCSAGYLELARAMVAQAESDETAADAVAALEAGAPDQSDEPPTSDASSDAATADPEPPGNGADGPAGPAVDTDTPQEAIAAPGPS